MKKRFSTAQVLTVVGDKMLCGDVGKVYEILDYLTNSKLWTHQLPDAARRCRPWILSQHPILKEYDDSSVNPSNFRNWLKTQIQKYGDGFDLEPLPPDDQLQTDPMRGIPDGAEVIAVIAPDREPAP